MAAIRVHEFMSLDGVIDAPTWTFNYGFDPTMGEAIAASMAGCQGILLGRTTYEMFEPVWSQRTIEDGPGAPFFNDTTKYVVSSTLTTTTWRNSQLVGPYEELHLFVYPLTRGTGPRLFAEDAEPHTLSLAGSASYDKASSISAIDPTHKTLIRPEPRTTT